MFTELFLPKFKEIAVSGVKVKFKGKIGVAGNSRTRTYFYRIGQTRQSSMGTRVNYRLIYIHTFTGVIGCHM